MSGDAGSYGPGDLVDFDPDRDLGEPGSYPFTRGPYPAMYRRKLWTMRQFAGFGTAEQTNARFRHLLDEGQTGLSTAFDMPTLMGLDSDHPLAVGEVGREGVAVDTVEDVERLFDGLPLERISVSMTINAPAIVLLAMYVVAAERRGIPRASLSGTLQTDILKEYIAQKEWIYPVDPAVRIVIDLIEFCAAEMPRWHPVSISGYHIREAGATAAEELAFTLADGIAYVDAAVARGLAVDAFAPRLSFFFNVTSGFFEEIAKLRAARRIWAQTMRERFNARNPRSLALRAHCQTSGVSLTAQDPELNVVRVALQALAAVLGGTQSLHTNAMDEALSLPTERAATLALRTQQIIAHETGITDTADPLGGSYYLENLTNTVERETLAIIEEIDAMGGMIEAVKRGYPQQRIADSAAAYQRAIESGQRIIIGVNRHVPNEEPSIPTHRTDPSVERIQCERLAAVRQRRNAATVSERLETVRTAARDGRNLVPPIIDAVSSFATLGEICDVMADVFGRYRETETGV